jgi:hypothetical protein
MIHCELREITAVRFNFLEKNRFGKLSESQIKIKERFVKKGRNQNTIGWPAHIKFYLQFLRFPPYLKFKADSH